MPIPLEVVLDRPGRTPLRLTPLENSLNWSTAAVGGFGDCTVGLPGPPPFWKREIPFLSTLRIVLGTQVIYEGLVEDVSLQIKDENSTVKAFGLQRNLQRTSVRRIWSMRNVSFVQRSPTLRTPDDAFVVTTGTFDTNDLTKSGIQYAGNTQTSNTALAQDWLVVAPTGLSWTHFILGLREKAGSANFRAEIYSAVSEGGGYTNHLTSATNGTFTDDFDTVANATLIMLRCVSTANFATAATDYLRWSSMRFFGTALREDISPGFYGGTILNDLVALVPGLTIGQIDAGSDFTLQSIERSIRDTALSVVSEVAGYYTREWGVWENGRFDWKTVNKDEPQWIATVADLDSGSELDTTVDGLGQTLYVLYADAASGLDSEASSASTSQRNPFVKQGITSDVINSPGFPMTSSSASQLASRIVGDENNYPSVSGRLIIPATKPIKRAAGTSLPAYMIRAGQNILVSDLPKTDLFQQGRDGESLFHIVSTNANLEQGQVTLEVEGQTRRSDVLLARLAAVTRTLIS